MSGSFLTGKGEFSYLHEDAEVLIPMMMNLVVSVMMISLMMMVSMMMMMPMSIRPMTGFPIDFGASPVANFLICGKRGSKPNFPTTVASHCDNRRHRPSPNVDFVVSKVIKFSVEHKMQRSCGMRGRS